MRFIYTFLLGVILLLGWQCSSPDIIQDNTVDYDLLLEAARQTAINFTTMENSTPTAFAEFIDIPQEFWEDEIARQQPIRLYRHYNNIAMVMSETETMEKGYYFFLDDYYDTPRSNKQVDFVQLTDSVFQFTRTK